jgi:proteic killer suppression protein
VIRSFADQATADVYVGQESSAARRIPKQIWPVVRRKLDVLHRARSVRDLRYPSGNRLVALTGDRAGEGSLRVNDQHRISFRFEDGHAHEVACKDDQ